MISAKYLTNSKYETPKRKAHPMDPAITLTDNFRLLTHSAITSICNLFPKLFSTSPLDN